MIAETYLPQSTPSLLKFGVRFSDGGPHTSRTIMLEEMRVLCREIPAEARWDVYRDAILNANVLGKKTHATRVETYERIRTLYGLSSEIPIFAAYRRLLALDVDSFPQLSILVAWSRDSLLRGTTSAILDAPPDAEVSYPALEAALRASLPGQYGDKTIGRIAKNAIASWTQSGHLKGRTKKTRQRLVATPAAMTLAIILGHASGLRGEPLLSSPWVKLLDLNALAAREKAALAHRMGFLDLKSSASVMEIALPNFSDLLEQAL